MDSPITIRALVILVLDAGPAYGGELRARIIERTSGAVTPGEGAIHSAIASLARDLLIEEDHALHRPTGGRPRRFWRWTPAGRQANLDIRQILADFCAIPLDPSAGSEAGPDRGSAPDQILDRPPATADLASRPD